LRCSELVVTTEGVVRERLPEDPICDALVVYDLEGEMFFGAAPELDRYFNELKGRALSKAIRVIVVRLKRTRNPDMVCLERLEHFIEDLKANGITLLLCGIRPDLARAMKNMGFSNCLLPEQVFPEEDDKDSATIKAVRHAYGLLEENTCDHCKRKGLQETGQGKLYYLV
jgi:sulfate permease, SulP family